MFIRAAVQATDDEFTQNIWMTWAGNNADKDQLEKVLSERKQKSKGKREPDQEQIQEDWAKLQAFIGGLT